MNTSSISYYEALEKIASSNPQKTLEIADVKTSIIDKNVLSGQKILPIIMNQNETYDIDNLNDWGKTEKRLIDNNH